MDVTVDIVLAHCLDNPLSALDVDVLEREVPILMSTSCILQSIRLRTS